MNSSPWKGFPLQAVPRQVLAHPGTAVPTAGPGSAHVGDPWEGKARGPWAGRSGKALDAGNEPWLPPGAKLGVQGGSAEGGGTASSPKRGSAKLLGPGAGPWLRDPAPQQPLVDNTQKKCPSREKQKVPGCPVSTARCGRRMSSSLGVPSLLAARDRAGTGQCPHPALLAQPNHSPGGEREWPDIPQAPCVPRNPEMIRSCYSISPCSGLQCGDCTFLKSCSYALGSTRSPSCSDTAPLNLPIPFFSPLHEPGPAGNWLGSG